MRTAITKGQRVFTGVVFHDDGWWVGYVEEVPGVNAQARTRKQLLVNLRLALHDILEAHRKEVLSEVPADHEEMTVTV